MPEEKEKIGLDKYTTDSEDKDRVLLSSDAFAVCEFIEMLIKKIEHTRLTIMR